MFLPAEAALARADVDDWSSFWASQGQIKAGLYGFQVKVIDHRQKRVCVTSLPLTRDGADIWFPYRFLPTRLAGRSVAPEEEVFIVFSLNGPHAVFAEELLDGEASV